MDNNTLKKEVGFWSWRSLECLYCEMRGGGGRVERWLKWEGGEGMGGGGGGGG